MVTKKAPLAGRTRSQNEIVFTGDLVRLWKVQNLKRVFKRVKTTRRDSRHTQSYFRA